MPFNTAFILEPNKKLENLFMLTFGCATYKFFATALIDLASAASITYFKSVIFVTLLLCITDSIFFCHAPSAFMPVGLTKLAIPFLIL